MRPRARQRGVTLVIALGTLAVFTLLVVGFATVMRNRRVTARAALDDTRARHLLYAGLSRAVSHVHQSMPGTVYPVWGALASPGTSNCHDVVSAEALAMVPASLWRDASNATPHWVYAVTTNGVTNGRVAWLVLNCSGFLDANVVGGIPRSANTNVTELDLTALPDVTGDPNTLFARRAEHRRYESVDELARANTGTLRRPIEDLFIYSYDPGRDAYIHDLLALGDPTATFPTKVPVNRVAAYTGTTYTAYNAAATFRNDVFDPLRTTFADAGFAASDALAWNVINYIDGDRLPHGDDPHPWLSAQLSEAIPLINEVVLREVAGEPDHTYEAVVELWFPFLPARAEAADGFQLEVGVFSNAVTGADADAALDAPAPAGWSFRTNITTMAYGGPAEFLVAPSWAGKRIARPDPASPGSFLPLSGSNQVWFLARVVQTVGGSNVVVDQAWAPDPVPIDRDGAWSVDDPRANGAPWHWALTPDTLGATNANCSAWADPGESQGLPIFHRDGPMRTIGELGHIYLPGATSVWRNIDLCTSRAGQLMDRLTVRATNAPAHGLVAMGTANTNVAATLFYNMPIGYSNAFVSVTGVVDAASATDIGGAIARGGPYLGFGDLMARALGTGPYSSIAEAFRACASNTVGSAAAADVLREAPVRNMVELVTFRQNLFTVILVAEALAGDQRTPVAREEVVALFHRDAYTGRTFLRSWRPLRD